MNKLFSEWTLKEVKEMCSIRNCKECILKGTYNHCLLGDIYPSDWELEEINKKLESSKIKTVKDMLDENDIISINGRTYKRIEI